MPRDSVTEYSVFAEHVSYLFQKLTQTKLLNSVNKETLIGLFKRAEDRTTNPNAHIGVTANKLFLEQESIFGHIESVSCVSVVKVHIYNKTNIE
jgi:hypothetical protein